MKKIAVVLAAVAATILVQGLTGPSTTTLDRILADASIAMSIPFMLVAVAFWAADE